MQKIGFKFKELIIACLTCLVLSTFTFAQKVNKIKYPLFTFPAIAKAGNSLLMEVVLEEEEKISEVLLIDSSDDKNSISIPFIQKSKIENGDNEVLEIKLPDKIKTALYDLSVKIEVGGGKRFYSDLQPRAVKVVEEFKKNFSFVHLTDIHFGVQDVAGVDTNTYRQKVLEEITKLNPEFVILTGDLVIEPAQYDKDFEDAYNYLLQYLKVPVFVIPGNHDQYYHRLETGEIFDGMEYWKRYFYKFYGSFDYGDLHFLLINDYDYEQKWRERYNNDAILATTIINSNIMQEQYEWIKKDLKSAQERKKQTLMFAHIPLMDLMGLKKVGLVKKETVKGIPRHEFLGLLSEFKVKYVFVGHLHLNDVRELGGGIKEVVTIDSGLGCSTTECGFRVVEVENGKIKDFSEIKKL